MGKLDLRLQSILDEIDCKTLLDIGCDHGKISVEAILQKKAENVIACDISPKSLEKTKILAKKYQIDDKVLTVVSDGFSGIDKAFDLALIAGMGGYEIKRILENTSYRGRLILVPHQDERVLRSYIDQRFTVKKDYIVECFKKFYSIIVLEKGCYKYTEEELKFGFIDKENPYFLSMLKDKRERLKKIEANSSTVREEYEEVSNLCKKLGI